MKNPCLAFGMVLALAGAAGAQTVPDDALYARGAALRAEHQDADALAIYRELFTRTHAPRALAQVAMAEGAMGQWTEAEAHLIAALASTDPWIAERRTPLGEALATMRQHLGSLVVESNAPGAEVFVDGHRIGPAGTQALRVMVGTVRVEVRAAGFVSALRVAMVPVGGLARERADLAALPPAVAVVATEAPVRPAPTVAASRPVVAGPAPERAGSARRPVAIASLATGGALLLGGVVAFVVGRSAADAHDEDAACPGTASLMQPPSCQERLDRAALLEPLSWTLMGFGAAALATGAVLLALPTGGSRGERARAVRCGPTAGAWGMNCAVRF